MPNNVTEIVPIVFNVEMRNRCLQIYFFKVKKKNLVKNLICLFYKLFYNEINYL